MSAIKILLVDDHHVVREGLRHILELDKGIQVIGEAKNGEEAITKSILLLPDVIMMDLKMPDTDGIAATREIKKRLPNAKILILTLYAEDFLQQAIEAGVSGYLLKDSDREEITKAIYEVQKGQFPIAPALTRNLVKEVAKLSRDSRSKLTKRQTDILKLISEGARSNKIGECLSVSTSTVKREIRNIFDKLGVNDRAQAIAETMKRKLI